MRVRCRAFVLLTLLSIATATVRAEDAKKPEVITSSIGMKLALIPAGEFMMGSPTDEEGHSETEQQHRVRITRPFYMGVYTVTQAEYERVMGKNPSDFSATGSRKDKVVGQDTTRFPVENVTWDDAQAFCVKLSQKEGKTHRLPTEAEWEYACRASTNTPFHFGKSLNGTEANCDGRNPFGTSTKGPHLDRTCAVGSYQSNKFGLYDMHGNVWQWCQDWHRDAYDANSPAEDPQGPADGTKHIIRGGCWPNEAINCRSAYRDGLAPSRYDCTLGFRVVLEIPAREKGERAKTTAEKSAAEKAGNPAGNQARIWRDAQGRQVEASLVELKDGNVTLRRKDNGKTVTLPSGRLSEADQNFLKQSAPAEPDATHAAAKTPEVVTNSIGMKLALIPAGEFTMGSPENEQQHQADEQQHRVRITRPFYIGVYPVTQTEYWSVIGKNPSWFSPTDRGKDQVAGRDTSRFPVEMVSWDGAQEFCRLLSQKEGKTYRLPTEAEWEYACRAGTTTPFHFGERLNGAEANCNGNFPYGTSTKGAYLERTTGVGSYRPNAFGLYDMHGNVGQWCSDFYGEDFYGNSPVDDPKGATSGAFRVARGGNWRYNASGCRSAERSFNMSTFTDKIVGFRLVQEKPTGKTPDKPAIEKPASAKPSGPAATTVAKTPQVVTNSVGMKFR